MTSILNTVRDLGRLREIVGVLMRHGFGELVQRTGLSSLTTGNRSEATSGVSAAVRIRLALEELGPSFVKMGQIVSTRPDLVPAELIEELRKLQDDVPPVAFEAMKVEIETQLGAPLEALFTHLDPTPLASASIGQVYRAGLRCGDVIADVVVKVQRPKIASVIERDIELLYWLAHAMERSIPEADLYSPVRVVGEFDRAICAELDFAQEADNAERFASNFSGNATVRFPKVYRQASSRKVITLEYLDGKDVFDSVAEGASGELIAKNAIGVLVKMIFEHGFFHADPHPGNILICGPNELPVIGLIDLGLVGRLSPKMRDRLIDLLVAVGRRDSKAMANALYAIGTPTAKVNRDAYEAEIARLADKYLGKKLRDIQFADFLRDLASGAIEYGVEVPPDYLMMGKALMTMEGIGRQIHPELDLIEVIQPYLGEILSLRYSPERISGDFLAWAMKLSQGANEFPARAEELLEDLRHGRLTVQTKQVLLPYAAERLGRRIYTGLVVSSMVIAGALLIATQHRWLGGSLLAMAGAWSSAHVIGMAMSKDRRKS